MRTHLLLFVMFTALAAGSCAPAPPLITPQRASISPSPYLALPTSSSTQPSYLVTLEPTWTMEALGVRLGTATDRPRIPAASPTNDQTPTPTPYPSLDLASIHTNTPPAPAQCPQGSPEAKIIFDVDRETNRSEFSEMILSAIEDGAPYWSVAGAFNKQLGYDTIAYLDLTGDGISELIVPQDMDTVVIGCDEGTARVLLNYSTWRDGGTSVPGIVYVGDMNMNGTPEVVFTYRGTSARNAVVDILEWDGQEFSSLITMCHGYDSPATSSVAATLYWYEINWLPREPADPCIATPFMNGYAEITIRDLDHNGTQELVLRDFGPQHPDTLLFWGPWRGKEVTFEWDGLHFIYATLKIDPPVFRFQALQDADRFFLLGEYDQAVAAYQDVIFSDKLEWWSEELMQFNTWAPWSVDPTPIPPPEDASEYPALAAYARYRLLLHHLARGWLRDAETVLVGLRREFAQDPIGSPYVEAANLLWSSFDASGDLAEACQAVVEYFTLKPALLAPLGDIAHGLQSHRYEPPDTCPIR